MNIGELAKSSGVSAKLIRYYESIGLLPAAQRTESNYRVYRPEDVHTLRFIKRSRSLGFGLDEIQVLVSLWQNPKRPSSEVKALVNQHIGTLENKLAEIQSILQILKQLSSCCHGDDRPDCPILDDLASTKLDGEQRDAHIIG